MGRNRNVKFMAQAALIAAVYVVLTILSAPLSFREIQVRISEMLAVLPFFTAAAIPGLFIGCFISNIFGGNGILDIVFGSLATLLAAYLSRKMPKKILAPLPPVVINAVVVACILNVLYKVPLALTMLWVGAGEFIACYCLGYPFMVLLDKYREKIF